MPPARPNSRAVEGEKVDKVEKNIRIPEQDSRIKYLNKIDVNIPILVNNP